MVRRFSLRLRLTFGMLGTFALVLLLLGLIIDQVRSRDLWQALDERLRDRAENVIETAGPTPTAARLGSYVSTQRSLRFASVYLQVADTDGTVVGRSRNLGTDDLPQTEASDTGRTFAQTGPDQQELRVLTVPLPQATGVLQIAADTGPTRSSIAELRRLIGWLAGFGTLLVGGTTWLIAGRMLAPLAGLAGKARDYYAPRGWEPVAIPASSGDEVSHLASALNDMGSRVDTILRAQDRFISDASHELKTPLAVVLAEAQVVRQQQRSTEEYMDFVGTVEEELSQLVHLVTSLLTLARADAGTPLAAEPRSLNEVVMDAVEACAPLARHREVRLVPHLVGAGPDGSDALICGDAQLLRTMFQNLLRNAIRYSPVDEAVDITVSREGETLCVAVRDRGPGIPPDMLERVFDRFFRLADAENWGEGVGIGLSMTRAILRQHGGSIEVTNHPDGGAEFVATLPAFRPDEAD